MIQSPGCFWVRSASSFTAAISSGMLVTFPTGGRDTFAKPENGTPWSTMWLWASTKPGKSAAPSRS